jgi:hypothetical protein
LVERLNGIQEVRGSIPLTSTNNETVLLGGLFFNFSPLFQPEILCAFTEDGRPNNSPDQCQIDLDNTLLKLIHDIGD